MLKNYNANISKFKFFRNFALIGMFGRQNS